MVAAAVSAELVRPVRATLAEPAADAAEEPRFAGSSRFGQCACPGDCDRDHDNE